MKQNFLIRGGRPQDKIRLSPLRRENSTRREHGIPVLFDKSGQINKAAFIKSVLLGKPFKVFVVDENTRIFIDKLSSQFPLPHVGGGLRHSCKNSTGELHRKASYERTLPVEQVTH